VSVIHNIPKQMLAEDDYLGHESGNTIRGETQKGTKLKRGFGSCSWALWMQHTSHGLLFLMPVIMPIRAPGHRQQSSCSLTTSSKVIPGQEGKGSTPAREKSRIHSFLGNLYRRHDVSAS